MALSPVAKGVQSRAVLLGLVQVVVGLLIGFTPPTAAANFRAVVGAHIEMTSNGMLQALVGMAVPLMDLPGPLLLLMEVLLMIGTWTNGFGLLAAGLTGHSSPLTPLMNASHPPKTVSPHSLCHGLLMLCAPTVLGAVIIGAVGVARGMKKGSDAKGDDGVKQE